ncbi:MAG: DUF192 domain-containing protein [Bdellovibrionota bacterium]
MRVENSTKNTSLGHHIVHATQLLARMKGLLGKQALQEGHGLWIEPCTSIHTFFMKFPIDVVFLSKNNVVVKTRARLLPFRMDFGSGEGVKVLELPVGTIDRTQTRVGDLLTFVL